MTTQKLFAVTVILFLLSVFILFTTPDAEAASCICEIKLDASSAIALD